MRISVRGSGRVRLPAELGTIRLRVLFEGPEQAEVARRTTRLAGELRAELERLTGAEGPIERFAVDEVSAFAWSTRLDGELQREFRSSIGARAVFRDFRALGDFAARWSTREGVELRDVAWSLTERTRAEHEREVLSGAVRDARERAGWIAAELGLGPVRPVSLAEPQSEFPEPGDGPGPLRAAAAFAGPGPQGLELSPEDVLLSAEVHAVFEASETDGRRPRRSR